MPVEADIFQSTAEAIVNPVDCTGAQGAGLALEFKRGFPKIGLPDEMLLDLTEEAKRTGLTLSALIRAAWKLARATIRASEAPPEHLLEGRK